MSENVRLIQLLSLIHLHLAVSSVHDSLLGCLGHLRRFCLVRLHEVAADPLGVLIVFVADSLSKAVTWSHHRCVAEARAGGAVRDVALVIVHADRRWTAQSMTRLELRSEHIVAGHLARGESLLSRTDIVLFLHLLCGLHGVLVEVHAEQVVSACGRLVLEALAHAQTRHVVALLDGHASLFTLKALDAVAEVNRARVPGLSAEAHALTRLRELVRRAIVGSRGECAADTVPGRLRRPLAMHDLLNVVLEAQVARLRRIRRVHALLALG